MTIVDHHAVDDLPWRQNYSVAHIAGSEQGVTSSLVYSEIGAGAGAPLHTHEDDELIVVLDGMIEARVGNEVQMVGSDHTVVVPSGVPHGFRAVGSSTVKLLGFFPVLDAFERTVYLEGGPPDTNGTKQSSQ
jgi:quercetin dioxygenase-like cupin family protein